MKTVNEVHIKGRLGKNAEMKTFTNGGSIVKLTVATDFSYKDKHTNQWVKFPEWHDIIVKGDKVKEVQYYESGDKVDLKGRLKKREYDYNGEKRYAVEVHCFEIELVADESAEAEINGNRFDSLNDSLPS